jgi:hypothetical protein
MGGTQDGKAALYIMGDVHGQFERLRQHLHAAGLIKSNLSWSGGTAYLWFIGDYCDRGPDGIAVIELIMGLQPQAAAAGGRVGALCGNHDAMLLAADRYGSLPSGSAGMSFFSDWLHNGGNIQDLDNLETIHVDWLASLPAMTLVGDLLLVHADAMFYCNYGESLEAVNRSFNTIMQHGTPQAFDRLLDEFSQRRAFVGPEGRKNLDAFLRRYGGKKLVHGHTPISKITSELPLRTDQPYWYQDGRCCNIDGGMYLGGPGFLYRLED